LSKKVGVENLQEMKLQLASEDLLGKYVVVLMLNCPNTALAVSSLDR